MKRDTVAWLVFLSLLSSGPVLAQERAAAAVYPSVSIDQTELRRITSVAVAQDYLIKIRLPAGYAKGTDRYPVLYLLDGDHAFAMATDIVQYLVYSGLPDLIIVSPAYGSKDTPPNGGTNMRNRDFQFPSAFPPSGDQGGEKYLQFLKEELIPYVEANFRTVPGDRTLWGYSYGASFSLHAMFREPALFSRYVIVDGFDDDLPEVERTFAKRSSRLPVTLYLASGTPGGELFRFSQTLRSRKYHGLRLHYADLAGINHFAIGGEGLARGLRAVLAKPSAFEALFPTAKTSGAQAAIARYRQLKRTSPNDYDFSESTLDELGWAFVEMDRLVDAIAVYALNASQYPDSSAAHYALAGAYRRHGDIERAVASYRRAVESNPKDVRAAEWLEKLRAPQR